MWFVIWTQPQPLLLQLGSSLHRRRGNASKSKENITSHSFSGRVPFFLSAYRDFRVQESDGPGGADSSILVLDGPRVLLLGIP